MPAMLYSLGYERRDLDEVVALLDEHGVEVLLDVRATPRSRKRGLSRTPLTEALERVGIEYRHDARLGVPSDDRPAFRRGDAAAVRRYRERIAGEDRDGVEHVASLARSRDVALLCFERDERTCHRLIVVELVCAQDPTVEHLAIP
jgi:uncharacterized protein (DUF488 family)